MTIKVQELLDLIKRVGKENGIITFHPLKLQTNEHDKRAIELIELLQDYTFIEAIEILGNAAFWLMIISSSLAANRKNDKGIQTDLTWKGEK